jgi:hypothetical protein
MKKSYFILLMTLLFLGVSGCYNDKEELLYPQNSTADCTTIDSKFSTAVNSIFQNKCSTGSGCHGAGSFYAEFLTYSSIFNKKTEISKRVFIDQNMPTAGSPQLTTNEKAVLKCWLDAGAPNN